MKGLTDARNELAGGSVLLQEGSVFSLEDAGGEQEDIYSGDDEQGSNDELAQEFEISIYDDRIFKPMESPKIDQSDQGPSFYALMEQEKHAQKDTQAIKDFYGKEIENVLSKVECEDEQLKAQMEAAILESLNIAHGWLDEKLEVFSSELAGSESSDAGGGALEYREPVLEGQCAQASASAGYQEPDVDDHIEFPTLGNTGSVASTVNSCHQNQAPATNCRVGKTETSLNEISVLKYPAISPAAKAEFANKNISGDEKADTSSLDSTLEGDFASCEDGTCGQSDADLLQILSPKTNTFEQPDFLEQTLKRELDPKIAKALAEMIKEQEIELLESCSVLKNGLGKKAVFEVEEPVSVASKGVANEKGHQRTAMGPTDVHYAAIQSPSTNAQICEFDVVAMQSEPEKLIEGLAYVGISTDPTPIPATKLEKNVTLATLRQAVSLISKPVEQVDSLEERERELRDAAEMLKQKEIYLLDREQEVVKLEKKVKSRVARSWL